MHAKRFGLWTSALACAALMGCAGSDANTRTARPGDMGATNAQPDTPATGESTPASRAPRGVATPDTTLATPPANPAASPANGGTEYPAPR